MKARRNDLATLLNFLKVKTRNATEIEKLYIGVIKTIINALEPPTKKETNKIKKIRFAATKERKFCLY